MKAKSNNVVKELEQRQKVYTFGENACIYQIWRRDENTLRMFIPLDIDGDIKSWSTNDNSNNHLIHGFFAIVSNQDGTVVNPGYVDTPLGITEIYRVAGGITLDFLAPGVLQSGSYIIQNLLTIEIY